MIRRIVLVVAALLPSLVQADASLSMSSRSAETWTEAPQKKGWFQLPDGYELTFVEDHRREVDGFIMRKGGVRTRFDSCELNVERFTVESLNAVRIGSRGGLIAELRGEDFYGNEKSQARTTLARISARYHEALKTVTELRRALERDPTLASARVALAHAQVVGGDRAGAVETVVRGVDIGLPVFYAAALSDPVVVPLLDDDRVKRSVGPRDGTAKLGDVAWSARLGLVSWVQEEDSEAESNPQSLVIQTLDGRTVDASPPVDALGERYLRDLGFKAGRQIVLRDTRCYDRLTGETSHDDRCWTRALRPLGAHAEVADGKILVGGKVVVDTFPEDDRTFIAGYLPEAHALYQGGMPMGPCTVGGAPGARSWIELYPIK